MPFSLDDIPMLRTLRKQPWFCRARQYLPMADLQCLDDRGHMPEANTVTVDWPARFKKPRVGIVPDFEPYPRWTKFCRLLQNNGFDYGVYNIHKQDWIERAQEFDIVVNIWSCEAAALQEMREKYHFLETYMGKRTFPSPSHAMLYEDKKLEYYVARLHGIPFAQTYISQEKADALAMVDTLRFPVVSKLVPSSGSVGVELVRSRKDARSIARKAFSRQGRGTHNPYLRQKNYVFFQEFIPNDGYDIRVIVTGNNLFGYYRKTPQGDFRASGMHMTEKRDLPPGAMHLALRMNSVVRSPVLVVDMVRSLKDEFFIIEFSPTCQMAKPEQLKVNGEPGRYVHDARNARFEFQKGRWWVHELALKEFLETDYLSFLSKSDTK